MKYEFIDKALFFPEIGILAVGDLHLGYDYMLRQSGVLIPERQVKDIINNLKSIISIIKQRKYNLKKVVFLGDITHAFGYEFQERDEILEVLDFLKTEVSSENIILIRGNHDTMDYTKGNMTDFYVDQGIAFLHGHKSFLQVFGKDVKIVVSGHLHPSIILAEDPGVKRETYKCFLEGKLKGKTFIVLPSFFGFVEGTPVNEYKNYYIPSFSIIPRKEILNAKVHIVGKDKVYNFGKVKDL